jgi:hypothetical protein
MVKENLLTTEQRDEGGEEQQSHTFVLERRYKIESKTPMGSAPSDKGRGSGP